MSCNCVYSAVFRGVQSGQAERAPQFGFRCQVAILSSPKPKFGTVSIALQLIGTDSAVGLHC